MPTFEDAVKMQLAGNLDSAEKTYRQLIAGSNAPPPAFQNLGAMLRAAGKLDEALSVYNNGLKLFPANPAILANRANIIRAKSPAMAFRDLEASLASGPDNINAWYTAFSILRDHRLYHKAYALILKALRRLGAEPRLLLGLHVSLVDLGHLSSSTDIHGAFFKSLSSLVEASLHGKPIKDALEIRLSFAFAFVEAGLSEHGLMHYHSAMALIADRAAVPVAERSKIDDIVNSSSWNIACALLKQASFQQGWKLFDYGLRVPVDGSQKWQRSLQKPFTGSSLPLWRGESLEGRRLLLLEEQGVGDSMMFLSLLPPLFDEALRVDVIVEDRLQPIYSRAYEPWGDKVTVFQHSDALLGKVISSRYDYQCPIGSICQYRYTSLESYAPRVPILTARKDEVSRLRKGYLAEHSGSKKLVGISWVGGLKEERILKKCPPLEVFTSILQQANPDIAFVSLQYGTVAPQIAAWRERGISVIHDNGIDPLVDMEAWLDQVAACDAVLSVANTTIHGAGGLNLPTLCLLSIFSDWRWLDDPAATHSYWYPSVGILRETRLHGWSSVAADAVKWLNGGI
ncbi:hypothetical protein [Vulcanococcus limneticus]|uniref:tetratricopeptide repeat protein n=1 Tax=Vulcanococcus limneticus TaxID=2170428 RepID=UPI00398BC3E6